VYLGPGVYRGPPEVYRGPCMKNMCLNSPIIFTIVLRGHRTRKFGEIPILVPIESSCIRFPISD